MDESVFYKIRRHFHDGRVCTMLVAQEAPQKHVNAFVFALSIKRVRGLRATSCKSSATVK